MLAEEESVTAILSTCWMSPSLKQTANLKVFLNTSKSHVLDILADSTGKPSQTVAILRDNDFGMPPSDNVIADSFLGSPPSKALSPRDMSHRLVR